MVPDLCLVESVPVDHDFRQHAFLKSVNALVRRPTLQNCLNGNGLRAGQRSDPEIPYLHILISELQKQFWIVVSL